MSAVHEALGLHDVNEEEVTKGAVFSASQVYRLRTLLAKEVATLYVIDNEPLMQATQRGRVEMLSQLLNESNVAVNSASSGE